jgi:hypothetical protein
MATDDSRVSEDVTKEIGTYLEEGVKVGEPSTIGPVAVYPVFGSQPRLDYITLSRALPIGFTIEEIPGSASVRDLIVRNLTESPVLLVEGEEVLGAQQNRTFDSTTLVPVGEGMKIPVSCVEAGRWDGRRNADRFSRAEQMAYPELRREKARQANRARQQGAEARADQQAVWDAVAARSDELRISSSTGSINDVFEGRRPDLRRMTAALPAREGQIGSILQIGSEIRTIDLVSRPDAYADLHDSLVQGYCLDGLTRDSVELVAEPVEEAASQFAEEVLATDILTKTSHGLGSDFRFESEALVGSGLVADGELIQLSVFGGR